MATVKRIEEQDPVTESDLLKALVALAVADRDEAASNDPTLDRSELVLARAGLNATKIASMTGKGYESVRGILRRSKGSPPRSDVGRG
jgi:hypothetical protein